MKPRITREHDKRQGYGRVYWEGGSAITDADLNAAFDAHRRQDEALARVWIAPAGSADDGWKAGNLQATHIGGQDMVDFDLAAGHYLLDGEVLRNPADYPFTDQPSGLSAALEPGMALAWPELAEIADAGGERFDAVVLDSRDLPVSGVEDSELDEVAMRSDPAARVRPSPKVRILTDVDDTCAAARGTALDRLAGTCATVDLPSPVLRSRGRLRVFFGDVDAPENPCAPELALGYFGRLNQTVKVMLTAPDRFVWAYRNGGALYRATIEDASTLRIVTPFRDAAHYPVAGQIVELCSWDSRLPNGEVTAVPLGRFHAIRKGYVPGTEEIVLDTPVDGDLSAWYGAQGAGAFLFVRFWEPPTVATATDSATGADVPLAETGVRLDFEHQGCAGDQWSFSLRGNAPETVFPHRMLEAGGQPPDAIARAADLIALIHWRVEAGAVTGHLHDCRRRVRPLWQLDRCCTLTVGDGVSSFGDYDRLADAIAALPHQGGRICLLPGRHRAGVSLSARHDVAIIGCRGQTTVVPGRGDAPVLTIEDCANILLQDFMIEDDTQLALAGARNARLALERIDTIGRGAAVSLVETTGLRITGCDFVVQAEPAIIPAEDYASLRPLVFVGGEGLDITDSGFRCATERLTLQSLGGLQIASGSAHVRIARNVILGGLGHGITLGHLNKIKVIGIAYAEAAAVADLGHGIMAEVDAKAQWSGNARAARISGADAIAAQDTVSDAVAAVQAQLEAAQIEFTENPIGISQVAIQGCLGIDPTLTLPDPPDDADPWEEYVPAGAVSHIHILDNEIGAMGGSGISIPAWNLSLRPTTGEMIVVGLVAERNHISACALVAVASTLDDNDLQEIGFGGITLQVLRGAKIGENVIQTIGTTVRSPSVGIYIASGHSCHIHDNMIADIGGVESAGSRNQPGVNGGIIVDDIAPIYGPPILGSSGATVGSASGDFMAEIAGAAAGTHAKKKPRMKEYLAAAQAVANHLKLPRTEALRVQNNQVMVNFGLSLDLRGAGSFHVADNHLSTLVARPNAMRPRLASSVSIVDTELPYIEWIVLLMVYFGLLGQKYSDFGAKYLLQILGALVERLSVLWDRGVIQVQNNHIRTENFIREDDALALVAVVSPFDVQISDNVLKSVHADLGAFTHAIAVGVTSVQVLSNRIESRPPAGVLDDVLSAGMRNTTSLNHASHPIAAIGTGAVPAASTNLIS